MSKFKVGDRVRVVAPGSAWHCLQGTVAAFGAEKGYQVQFEGSAGRFGFLETSLAAADVTEHPALTLAKAEVVRLHSGRWDHSPVEQGQIRAYRKILRAFGLEYRAKPVVPQPPEYEFVTLDDTRTQENRT